MNPLTTYQENLMTLNRFIDEKEISKHILNLKEDIEQEETKRFHIELWSSLMDKYYKSREYSLFTKPLNHFIYFEGGRKYIYETHRVMDFYNETGISFQSRELLLATLSQENMDGYTSIIPPTSVREINDHIYGNLSDKIMSKMKILYFGGPDQGNPLFKGPNASVWHDKK